MKSEITHLLKYLILLFIISSCQEDNTANLKGNFNKDINEELYVTGILPGPIMDTISVKNGKFQYNTDAQFQDILIISNATKSIFFSFVKLPGKFEISWKKENYFISGEMNNVVKSGYEFLTDQLKSKNHLGSRKTTGEKERVLLKNELNDIDRKMIDYLDTILNENRNNIIGTLGAYNIINLFGDDPNQIIKIDELLNKDELKKTEIGAFVLQNIARTKRPESIPDVKLIQSNSEDPLYLADTLTNLTFIDFWASWCAPCRKDIPLLKSIHQRYSHSNKINFISISIDSDSAKWQNAIEEEKMDWGQFLLSEESKKIVRDHWGVLSIPHGVLIGKNHVTLENHIRSAKDLDSILIYKLLLQ